MRTISRVSIAIGISTLTLLSPTSARAQKTTYDYSHHFNLARMRTFAFRDVAPENTVSAKTTTYDSPFVDQRTQEAVQAQLESRGMKRDDANPDVYVVTRRTYKTEYTVYGGYDWGPWGYGWGGPWGYGYPRYGYAWGGWGGWGPAYVDEEIRGTLTVDIEDAESGALVWRGVGSKHVHEHSKPASRTRRANELVADIFKNFPPLPR
jgi:hypothetical protein